MFKLKVIFTLVFLFLSTNLIAYEPDVIVDIYGTGERKGEMISKKFQQKIRTLAILCKKTPSDERSENIRRLSVDLIASIRQFGDFEFTDLSLIFYPNHPEMYVTIDVVEKEDKERLLQFFSQPIRENIPDSKDGLIKSWQEYEERGFELMFKDKNVSQVASCPAYHCLFSFDHPDISKYKERFKSVEKNKVRLIEIFRNDSNDHRRVAAAYLLAHIKDGQELIALLAPSIHDPSPAVRNAVMRVLGETLSKVVVKNFPIEEAVAALSFPFTTDRNKALYIIMSLVDQPDPKYADYVRKHAGKELIVELKMLQPNVHGLAYAILKKLSKKGYGDRDIQAWENWIKEQNKR